MAKQKSSLNQLLLNKIEEEIKRNPDFLKAAVSDYLAEKINLSEVIHEELFDKVEEFALEAFKENENILREAISEEVKMILSERGDYLRELMWEEDVQIALAKFLAKKLEEE